jgi:hypothetical protein
MSIAMTSGEGNPHSAKLIVVGGVMEDIAMNGGDLAVFSVATAVAAGAALAIQSVRDTDYYCPSPSAASVATLFAPCQAFDTAMGHKITKKEAVQMGLLTPEESATRSAEGSAAAEWINPRAVSVGMQMGVRWPMRPI